MLPKNRRVRKLIQTAAKEGMAMAELECIGLSMKVLNILEEKLGIVYLRDLLKITDKEFLEVTQLGAAGRVHLTEVLARFSDLEKERQRWHKGSERLAYYQQQIPEDSNLT